MERWTETQIFHSGDDYYGHLISDIRKAQSSITLESYIFAVDKITRIILTELGQAKKRGCRVQLLVDGFGSYYWLPELRRVCHEKKLELKIYHPLPQSLSWFRRFFFMYLFTLKIWRFVKKLNKRTHRKITILDQKKAYLGSLNFTQLHSESVMGMQAWRDTGISVVGDPVEHLVKAFAFSWRRAHNRGFRQFLFHSAIAPNYDPRKSLVRLNSTPRMRFLMYRDLIRRIHEAQNHIQVTTAYFLPKRSLLRALKSAADRGVKVEIIVPGVTDVPIVRWAAFGIALTLLRSKVLIYEYQARVLHAKYMIIDDYCSIGSLNLNYRSLLHDLEVEVVLDNEKDKDNLREQWQLDRQNSKLLKEEIFKKASWWFPWLSRIAFKLRYLL